MSYSTILPAPGSLINSAGVIDPAGLPAPGFSGLNIRSNYNVGINRTRSNRGFPVEEGDFYWSFNISYNPMRQEEYEALESFLMGHNTRKKPFYVTLPNYAAPRDIAFATHAISNPLPVVGNHYAGDTEILINTAGFPNQNLNVGCYVNFINTGDALHKSTYKIARVETTNSHAGISPGSERIRVTIFPPLQRDVPTGTMRVINPQFRVIQTNQINPDIDRNNIFTVNLEVEELLP